MLENVITKQKKIINLFVEIKYTSCSVFLLKKKKITFIKVSPMLVQAGVTLVVASFEVLVRN